MSEEQYIKLSKKYKIGEVKSSKLSGPITKKLGCFKDSFQVQLLIMEMFENMTNEDLIKFKKKFVTTTKELDEFKEILDFCDKSMID